MNRTSRLTRTAQVALAVVLAVVLTACLSGGQQSVADEMNADRRENVRRTLATHDALNRKAQAWAEKLARDNALSHSTLSSGLPSCWRGVGENVGFGSSIPAVQAAYMKSPGHRKNILDTTWDFVGVGSATRGSRVFTVQVFMRGCR
jgi:uncharacterized protein YkwD